MIDIIAGICVGLLLAALYAVRRHASQARKRKRHMRASSQGGRALSARTEMRACGSATIADGMLKERARRAPTDDWRSA